ncbi:hypothetical protein ACWFRJ_09655 [Streptomyces sp. NPDC055239]
MPIATSVPPGVLPALLLIYLAVAVASYALFRLGTRSLTLRP